MWLNAKGLGSCWGAFRNEEFTSLYSLFSLTSDNLKELGLKMGQRNHFMAELDHLATYSNEQLTSMGVSESGLTAFSIAARKFLEKVTGLFSSEMCF